MSTLRSIHFGVNKVDPAHYGTEAPLKGCENDARAMQSIAAAIGYKTSVFLTKEATSRALLDELAQAAGQLGPGDVLLLTLACHGSQLDDVTGDEDDKLDETWCLYDRMLIDDEFFAAASKFRDGVTIFVVSDSCHSGSSTRNMMALLSQSREIATLVNFTEDVRFRCIDPFLDHSVFDRNLTAYQAIKIAAAANEGARSRGELWSLRGGPNVVLFSGCQDSQTSADGAANGLFTQHLLEIWNKGAYAGDCDAFVKAIDRAMNSRVQTPNLFPYGPSVGEVLAKRPFYPGNAPMPKPAKKQPRKNGAASQEQPPRVKNVMENSMLHPAVIDMLRSTGASRAPIFGDVGARDFESGCFIKINRSMFDGKTDKEILSFFADVVAPEICSNYFVARDAFSGKTPRGGSVSCSASTSGGGSVSCTGTWSF